ncbi:hypothetical protein [Saccharothrix sp. HUAS TT1]|uniref:hypothetical protein n=1 Tax=unclassified Saccharothrix TaxID=2593673 RepID=UPI00345BF847
MSRYRHGDAVVGDYAWGGATQVARPVIRANPKGVVLGMERGRGGWLNTLALTWEQVRGVLPAVDGEPVSTEAALEVADRLRAGTLAEGQRGAVASLLLVLAVTAGLPRPVVAALAEAVAPADIGGARPAPPVGRRPGRLR